MNNLLSYYGLVDTKIRVSVKDLPVPTVYRTGEEGQLEAISRSSAKVILSKFDMGWLELQRSKKLGIFTQDALRSECC